MNNKAGVKDLLERLERWLAQHRPRFLAGLAKGAAQAELDRLPKALGRPVPEDLRTLLAWHNGQNEDFIGRFEENWLLMSCQRIMAAKADLDEHAADSGWNVKWIPFLDDDAGDYLCLNTSRKSNAVHAFWLGAKEHPVVATSLADWLRDFVENVEKGRYAEDPERGTFLRS